MRRECRKRQGPRLKQAIEVLGYSRDAYYKRRRRQRKQKVLESIVLDAVRAIRIKQPRVGTRKLLARLQSQQIQIGRDSLFKLLRNKDMLVCKKKKATRTTYSNHSYVVAPNRLKNLKVTRPLEVLVGDITYLRLEEGKFAYLYLLTDYYSRRIVGHHVSKDLSHYSALIALHKVVANVGEEQIKGAIHHTDRGCQYCCHDYLQVLAKYGIIPSMTDENHCYQNAVAERVNGILKDELDLDSEFTTFSSLKNAVDDAILVYNEERTHWSLHLKTPNQVFEYAA